MTEDFTCRICLEDECNRVDLIAPCSCKGTQKWVHRQCLDQWRTTQEDRAFSKCTDCHTAYTLVNAALDIDTPEHRRNREILFALYVARDISLAFITLQFIIFLFSILIWAIDHKSSALLHTFHALKHPFVRL